LKKIVSGISFLFFGLVLYLTVRFQAQNQLSFVTEWPTAKGKWWGALDQTHGLLPTYFGIGFCVLGVILVLWGTFEDGLRVLNHKIKALDEKMAANNKEYESANAAIDEEN
jgi:hypothetical protein